MRYVVSKSVIEVLGKLWMPNATAATRIELSSYDLGNIEDVNDRDSVADWLSAHSGDFSEVLDFRADLEVDGRNIVHEWEKGEESEFAYSDCMYPSED